MDNFKFELKERVLTEKNELEVVIGRASYIQQPNFYLCQKIESYHEVGFNFLKATWITEDNLKKVDNVEE